jgi:hypothetical protein
MGLAASIEMGTAIIGCSRAHRTVAASGFIEFLKEKNKNANIGVLLQT